MVFHLNNRKKSGSVGTKGNGCLSKGQAARGWHKGGKGRLVGGKNPGQDITQGQAGNGKHPGNRPQVVSYVAFNVKPVMDALTQFLNGVVQLAALIGGLFFQYVYRNSISH